MMTGEEITKLIQDYWLTEEVGSDVTWYGHSTQYDDRSASINYGMVRHFKPKVVVEFGSRTGRCTHDMLKALIRNGKPYTLKTYEIDDGIRKTAQKILNDRFKDQSPIVGGDITKATDLPNNIDYLFIDNSHDLITTKWVFEYLLPKKCKDGCIVQIHDVVLKGDFDHMGLGVQEETQYILDLHNEGKLPLEKLYWTGDEGNENIQSSWWIYRKK